MNTIAKLELAELQPNYSRFYKTTTFTCQNKYVCDTQVNTSKLSIIQQPFTEHRAEAFMALKEPYFPLDYASEASYFWYIY